MVQERAPDSERTGRILNSLKAAWGRSLSIQPELCEAYVQAWRADRKSWQQHLAKFQPSRKQNHHKGDVDKVVTLLGLALKSKYLTG